MEEGGGLKRRGLVAGKGWGFQTPRAHQVVLYDGVVADRYCRLVWVQEGVRLGAVGEDWAVVVTMKEEDGGVGRSMSGMWVGVVVPGTQGVVLVAAQELVLLVPGREVVRRPLYHSCGVGGHPPPLVGWR